MAAEAIKYCWVPSDSWLLANSACLRRWALRFSMCARSSLASQLSHWRTLSAWGHSGGVSGSSGLWYCGFTPLRAPRRHPTLPRSSMNVLSSYCPTCILIPTASEASQSTQSLNANAGLYISEAELCAQGTQLRSCESRTSNRGLLFWGRTGRKSGSP